MDVFGLDHKKKVTAKHRVVKFQKSLSKQGRRHGFESKGTNSASEENFWPPTFWPVRGQNIA